MKKLGLTIIALTILIGMATPLLDVSARQSGAGVTRSSSAFHHLYYGHNGTRALTEHSQRHGRANASLWTSSNGSLSQTVPQPGQTAHVSVTVPSSMPREHSWRTFQ